MSLAHSHFRQIGDFLRPGDLLVLNQTRVIPARIYVRKLPGGGRAELLLLRKVSGQVWEAMVGGKGLKVGRRLQIAHEQTDPASLKPPADVGRADWPNLEGEVLEVLDGPRRIIQFTREIEPYLDQIGHVPLPPYIQRPISDPDDYQTIYARQPGSAAAPTAGLHFTPGLIAGLQAQGIRFAYVTLHIGLDTFAPVTADRPDEHAIHSEWCQLGPETAGLLNSTRANGGRIVAVGTTSVRTLETAARQADPAEVVAPVSGPTDLFILPGYSFRAVDAMITNFHLPRSTLLMMLSAFVGRAQILAAYRVAVEEKYRFYSFGDAMLIT